MRTVRAKTASTMIATIRTMIKGTIRVAPLFVDERCGALNLDDLDLRARLEHLIRHVRARRPFLAADLDPAAMLVDALQHDRVRALQCSGARAQRRRHAQVRARDRAEEEQRPRCRAGEDEELQPDGDTDERDE